MLRFLSAITLFATAAHAQPQAPALPRAPIRPLGEIIAKAPITFDTLLNVRGLSDGRIIVNDPVGHKLIVLDPTFMKVTVWSDTSAASKVNYGLQPAIIMPVAADSSVMLDARSNALSIIDPQGNFGRVFALPKTQDAPAVALSTMYGGAGIDPQGRLVYFGRPTPVATPNPGCSPSKPNLNADSVPLIRANFETSQLDTIATVRFSMVTGDIVANPNMTGCWMWRQKADVLPYYGDQWTLLADGTVAIVRQHDYHIDWIAPDGTKTSSPKMMFDWRPISPEEKQQMIDSVTKIMDSVAAARVIPAGAPPGFRFPVRPVVGPTEIPDYYPPTRLGSLRVDFDGNLWIPPTTSRDATGGGLLYDVVNRKGEVLERVQLPAGRSIAAFVPNGRVVLRTRDGSKITLELARVR